MDSLTSLDSNERAIASIELGDRSVQAAIPELRKLRVDPNIVVALAANYACWRLSDDFIDVGTLASALTARDESARQFASEVVSRIGDPLVGSLSQILHRSINEAESALNALDDIHSQSARLAVSQASFSDDSLTELQSEILQDWSDDEYE